MLQRQNSRLGTGALPEQIEEFRSNLDEILMTLWEIWKTIHFLSLLFTYKERSMVLLYL